MVKRKKKTNACLAYVYIGIGINLLFCLKRPDLDFEAACPYTYAVFFETIASAPKITSHSQSTIFYSIPFQSAFHCFCCGFAMYKMISVMNTYNRIMHKIWEHGIFILSDSLWMVVGNVCAYVCAVRALFLLDKSTLVANCEGTVWMRIMRSYSFSLFHITCSLYISSGSHSLYLSLSFFRSRASVQFRMEMRTSAKAWAREHSFISWHVCLRMRMCFEYLSNFHFKSVAHPNINFYHSTGRICAQPTT